MVHAEHRRQGQPQKITIVLPLSFPTFVVVAQTSPEGCPCRRSPSSRPICGRWWGRCRFMLLWLHPRNLTWNLKIMVSKWTFLFQGLIFRFHVNLPGCSQPPPAPNVAPPEIRPSIGFSYKASLNPYFWGGVR